MGLVEPLAATGAAWDAQLSQDLAGLIGRVDPGIQRLEPVGDLFMRPATPLAVPSRARSEWGSSMGPPAHKTYWTCVRREAAGSGDPGSREPAGTRQPAMNF
ncbi:hypothetical protein [Micromonospora sp. CB01531]|uniref:hypothetical protein n=1 Tax=Micromonospora sp. CB01531 TaxID=1718947 RepID=UPI0011614FBC|nr:hypothetical protein [Micromonospora sp. CB01531]